MRNVLRSLLAVTVLALTSTGVAVVSAEGASDSALDSEAVTCAYRPGGRLLGCLSDVYGEDLSVDVRGRTILLHGSYGPKELDRPPADTAGERVRPGVWRIVNLAGTKRVIGQAVATNTAKSRWRITNARGKLIAMARGPDGPKLAMVILSRGTDFFG
jgi:hypothetical protein